MAPASASLLLDVILPLGPIGPNPGLSSAPFVKSILRGSPVSPKRSWEAGHPVRKTTRPRVCVCITHHGRRGAAWLPLARRPQYQHVSRQCKGHVQSPGEVALEALTRTGNWSRAHLTASPLTPPAPSQPEEAAHSPAGSTLDAGSPELGQGSGGDLRQVTAWRARQRCQHQRLHLLFQAKAEAHLRRQQAGF